MILNLQFKENPRVCVIGLGYVGLPLAVALGLKFEVLGYDIDAMRIQELENFYDKTEEITKLQLQNTKVKFSADELDFENCDIFIVTLPTPIDEVNQPDTSYICDANTLISKYLKKGAIIIYESTVYPGFTVEECIPQIERETRLQINKDFFVGYSPERINPGDKERSVSNICKVTSGSNPEAADYINKFYSKIIDAGTFKASSITVAEMAKVIENTQRDVNIGLINEISMICQKMQIETHEVLEAAGTKWNFIKFSPGLVGGHCIGVDPYYLSYKALKLNLNPRTILAGRETNEAYPKFIAQRVIKEIIRKKMVSDKILILGLTFKENCPDIRNSKSFALISEIEDYGFEVDAYDPYIGRNTKNLPLGNYSILEELRPKNYSAILIAVAHDEFKSLSIREIRDIGKNEAIIYDIKDIYPAERVELRS